MITLINFERNDTWELVDVPESTKSLVSSGSIRRSSRKRVKLISIRSYWWLRDTSRIMELTRLKFLFQLKGMKLSEC